MIVIIYFSAPTAQLLANAVTKVGLANVASSMVSRRAVSTACEKSDRKVLNAARTNARINPQVAKHHSKVYSIFTRFPRVHRA